MYPEELNIEAVKQVVDYPHRHPFHFLYFDVYFSNLRLGVYGQVQYAIRIKKV